MALLCFLRGGCLFFIFKITAFFKTKMKKYGILEIIQNGILPYN